MGRRRKQRRKRSWLQFEAEASWFALASAMDVALTFLSLRYSAAGRTSINIVESNPIARWVIREWGLTGMVVFKLLLVTVVVAIAEVAGRSHPRIGRLLLIAGTMVTAAVVVYSFNLLKGSIR